MKLILNIEPKPQARPRSMYRAGRVIVHEDSAMKKWRRQCTLLVKQQWQGEKLQGAIKVEITFFLKAPQAISKKPTPRAKEETKQKYQAYLDEKIRVTKKPDLDNLIKSVFDSISDSAKVWNDDYQICEITASKFYSESPRIEIDILEV